VIEDDVWLCAGSVVLPGVRVKKGTVVAAGAVVTKDTEPYSIVGGIPAVKIGQRTDPHECHTNTLLGAFRIMCLGFIARMTEFPMMELLAAL